MLKLALLVQIVAFLPLLAAGRRLLHEDSNEASFASMSSDCLKFDSAGIRCERHIVPGKLLPTEDESSTQPEELAADRTYEPSPPKRTLLYGSSSSSGDALIDLAAPSRRQLAEDDFEETMRTDYAPVRRKPPINNEIPFFSRKTSP